MYGSWHLNPIILSSHAAATFLSIPVPSCQAGEEDGENTRMSNIERTYIMIKPDGVQRGFIGRIISRFEDKGFRLVGLKMLQAEDDILNEQIY